MLVNFFFFFRKLRYHFTNFTEEKDFWNLLVNKESGKFSVLFRPNSATKFINSELAGAASFISVKTKICRSRFART